MTKSSAIMFNFQALNERPSKGLAGMNASDFMTRYFKLNNNGVFSGTDYAGLAYDSVWAIALGLNATVDSLKGTGKYRYFNAVVSINQRCTAWVASEQRAYHLLILFTFTYTDFSSGHIKITVQITCVVFNKMYLSSM